MTACAHQFFPDLTTLTETHRMSSAISALASVSDALFNTKVFPEGSAQLEGLLWATLPGIDATDVMKTMNTLHFHLASGRERASADAALGCAGLPAQCAARPMEPGPRLRRQ